MTNESNLQQTGAEAVSTGNPQQVVQGGLQPQAQSNLQPTSNQSVDAIKTLDQGGEAISLSAISNTTTATVQTPVTQTNNSKVFIYGAIGIICAAILVYMTYNLLKPRS